MKKMLFHLICFALMVLVLTGCGSSSTTQSKLSTPRKAWDEFIAAMKADDAQRFYDLLSTRFTKGGATVEDARKTMDSWKSIGITPEMYDQINVLGFSVQGPRAEVQYALPGHESSPAKTVFVKENGEWKLYE